MLLGINMTTRPGEADKQTCRFDRAVLPLSQGFAFGLRRCLQSQAKHSDNNNSIFLFHAICGFSLDPGASEWK
jgi:hypothetical protein